MRSLAERFWEKVRIGDGCWIWAGAQSAGYGNIRVLWSGVWKTTKATRVMWFLTHGEWPTQFMLHSCDNPICVNPDHLSEGTGSDNKQQEITRGRNYNKSLTHCPAGHEYTDENTYRHTELSRRCRECNRLSVTRYRTSQASQVASPLPQDGCTQLSVVVTLKPTIQFTAHGT